MRADEELSEETARLVADALGLVWDTIVGLYVDPSDDSIPPLGLRPDGSNLGEAWWFKACTLRLSECGALLLGGLDGRSRVSEFLSAEGTDIQCACPIEEAPARLLAELQSRRCCTPSDGNLPNAGPGERQRGTALQT